MSKYDRTSYEWTLETLGNYDGTPIKGTPDEELDIIDSDFRDETNGLDDFRQYIGKIGFRVGLVRDTHDTRDGYLVDRTWAYFNPDGKLDTHFRSANGRAITSVPKRFIS
jgi:hypothetical protein